MNTILVLLHPHHALVCMWFLVLSLIRFNGTLKEEITHRDFQIFGFNPTKESYWLFYRTGNVIQNFKRNFCEWIYEQHCNDIFLPLSQGERLIFLKISSAEEHLPVMAGEHIWGEKTESVCLR